MNSFSKSEAIKYGWETFKKYPWVLVGVTLTVTLVPQLIQSLLEIPFGSIDQNNSGDITPLIALGTVISIVVTVVLSLYFSVGILKLYLKLINNKPIVYKDLFSANKEEIIRYLIGSLVYGLIVFAGLILLIIPGIYWGIKYQYYSYLILDKKAAPMDSIKESGKITQGNIGNLFIFNILLICISILGILALFVGIFIATPVVGVAQAYVYRKLVGATTASPAAKK